MNGYIRVKKAAVLWDITEHQGQRICEAGRIPGVMSFGNSWAIPEDATKPTRTTKLKPGRKRKSDDKQETDGMKPRNAENNTLKGIYKYRGGPRDEQ